MSQSAYDDITGVEEDLKHPDTPDSPRPGLGHLRAPRTLSPASDPESYRALVAVPGRAPLQVSRAQQGSTGYPPQCDSGLLNRQRSQDGAGSRNGEGTRETAPEVSTQ